MMPKNAYRPVVETLESRLQPGSLLLTSGAARSLADNLSLLNPPSPDTHRVVYSSSAPSSKPAFTSPDVDVHSYRLDLAIASVAAARSQNSSTPSNDLVNRLDSDLLKDDLSNVSLTGRRQVLPLAALAASPLAQSPSETPLGSVPQSPIGVAAPAPVANSIVVNGPSAVGSTTPVKSTAGYQAVPVQMVTLTSGTIQTFDGFHVTDAVHAQPLALGNRASHASGGAGNQATLNFLSYLGGSGPDAINSMAVRNEDGNNFIYVAGSVTDNVGRTDALVAKLADGGTTVVWSQALFGTGPGPDSAFGLALNGNSVYVAGSFANPAVRAQTDGFLARLDSVTGQLLGSGGLANGSLAAITIDPAGNVYAAGSIPDPVNANQQDVALVKAPGDLSSTFYSAFIRLMYLGPPRVNANTAVTTGGGLIVDGQGNLFYAGSVSRVGDPIHDTTPLYGWVTEISGLPFRRTDVTAFNPTPGPRGKGTAVAFDPSGNVVFTGSFNNDGGTPLNQDMFLGRLQPTGAPVAPLRQVDGYRWVVDDRTPAHLRAGDWTGNGLVVLADGSTIVTGATYDPAAPKAPPQSLPTAGIDIHMTHFVPTDNGTPTAGQSDADPENIFGGTGSDFGNAVALDPTNPTNVYVVGSTDSIDLPTTSGVVQPTYGGSSTTGFVGQASIV